MKKNLILLCGLFTCLAYADGKVNLDKQSVTCGNYKLTNKSTASDIMKYCAVKKYEDENHLIHTEQEIKFEATITTKMKCEFSGDKLEKCKID